MQKISPTRPKAFLIDLDGTLYFKGEPCPGAIETVNYLRQEKYQLRFLTNTTAKTPRMLHAADARIGLSTSTKMKFSMQLTPVSNTYVRTT